MAASTIACAGERRGSAWFFSAVFWRNCAASRSWPGAWPGGRMEFFERSDRSLDMALRLRIDLDAECCANLADTFQRRLLRRDDCIHLPHAQIGEKVRLVHRPLGVPDVGKFGPRARDGSCGRTFLDEGAQPVGRLLACCRQIAFQLSYGPSSASPGNADPRAGGAVATSPYRRDHARLRREISPDGRCGRTVAMPRWSPVRNPCRDASIHAVLSIEAIRMV